VNDKLFIPQTVLYRWVDTGKVTFDNSILTLLAEKKAYTVTPAVRFMSLVAGDDALGLLTKVRTLSKLKDLGAEHLSDSVILGDNAYEVQEGFIGVVLADTEVASTADIAKPAVVPVPATIAAVVAAAPVIAAPVIAPVAAPVIAPVAAAPASIAAAVAAAPAPTTPGSLAAAATGKPENSDADMLTKFLLNNLNF